MEKQFPVSPIIVPEWIDLVKSLSTFPNEPLSVAARTQWTYRVLRATLKSQGKCDPLDVTKEEAAGVSLTVVHFVCSGHVCKINTGKSLGVRRWKVLMHSLKKKKTHNYWRKATLRGRFQPFVKIPAMDEILEGLPLPSEERALGDSRPLEYQGRWCCRLWISTLVSATI